MAGFRLALAILGLVFGAVAAAAAPLTLPAYVMTEAATGRPALSLTLSPESASAFGGFTSANVGRRVELRIDGRVLMNPVIRDPILKGEVMVSGDFTRLERLEAANGVWSGKATVDVEAVAD